MPEIAIRDEAHWHELRAQHGGSSEAPALFGLGYVDTTPSLWALWARKSGRLPSDPIETESPSSRLWWGKRLEPIIAEATALTCAWDLERREVYVTHPNPALRMGATVDYYVLEHEDGPGIVECKARSWLQWRDEYTDDRPHPRDLVQLAHQLACHPHVRWGAVSVLVGGEGPPKVYRYSRADLARPILDVESAWADLWDRVATGREPDLTAQDLPDWASIDREWIADPPLRPNDPGAFDELARVYAAHRQERLFHEKCEAGARARLLQAMQEHRHAVGRQRAVALKIIDVPPATIERKPYRRIDISVTEIAPPDEEAAAAEHHAAGAEP